MNKHQAYAKVIRIAAQLARGSMLPNYEDMRRVSGRVACQEMARAADALREMAVELRDAVDALREPSRVELPSD